MKVRNRFGNEFDLIQEKIDILRLQIQGQLLLPDDSGYEISRTIWNGMIDRRPSIIVRCLGVADVIKCVKFAKENDLLICIKGGGHNIAGLATADGALMLDMSLMRGVWVNEKNRTALAQAGCLLSDVDRESQLFGLATILGFVSQTGIAGLTLGGGFGYLTRRWGWTADNVVSMDLVTADGEIVKASNRENTDLFWGLRGGGGNFGVVTNIEYNLYPVGPEIIGGLVAWPASEAAKVLDLYRTLAEDAPPELTLVALIRLAPPAPWLPKEWHGKLIVAILGCYSGRPEDGEKIVAPIKAFGKPIGDILIRRPYVQMQSLLDATQPKGRRYYWKSEYLSNIEPELCAKIINQAAQIPSPHSAIILFQIGGALNQLDQNYSPVGNRNAHYVFNISGSWDLPEKDLVNIEWAKKTWNDLKKFSTGGTYINFLNEDEGPERTNDALGSSLKRLFEVKKKWDPDNLFCTNRNIKPI